MALVSGQLRMFREFWRAIGTDGADVLCYSELFPGVIRMPLFLVAGSGPLREADIRAIGLDVDTLLQRGLLRTLQTKTWFGLTTLNFDNLPDREELERLRWLAWNPIPKLGREMAWRRSKRGLLDT